jgi:hypothetical protein
VAALRVLLVALLAVACVPELGPFRLAEVRGRVVDADTGAPLAGALVIEWHRGAGPGGASQPVYHARWATSDPAGEVHLAASVVPSARMWLLKTYEPDYALFHPSYGLQRGTRRAGDRLVLRGSLARAEQGRADLLPYCRGEHTDAGARRLAEVACAERPQRPPAARRE